MVGIEEIEKQHKKIDAKILFDYDIGGLVYKVNDLNLQKRLETLQIHQGGLSLINFQLKKQLQNKRYCNSSRKDGAITPVEVEPVTVGGVAFQMQHYTMRMKLLEKI